MLKFINKIVLINDFDFYSISEITTKKVKKGYIFKDDYIKETYYSFLVTFDEDYQIGIDKTTLIQGTNTVFSFGRHLIIEKKIKNKNTI